MSNDQSHSAIQDVVTYLKDTSESLDAQTAAVKNAAEAAGVEIKVVLNSYAHEVSVQGGVYPSDVEDLNALIEQFSQEYPSVTLPKVEDICGDLRLIETRDDVLTHGIEVYTMDDVADEVKKDVVSRLVKDAQDCGIDVSADDIVTAIEQYQSNTERPKREDIQTVEGRVITPTTIRARERNRYQVSITSHDSVDQIQWYIGGDHAGSGEEIVYTFPYSGTYTISVEITVEGNTAHIQEDVTVAQPEITAVAVEGDTHIERGSTAEYRLSVTGTEGAVDRIEWLLDGTSISKGKTITHRFEQEGNYTITANVEDHNGNTFTDSTTVNVVVPTGITATIDAPDVAYIGENTDIGCELTTDNAEIEDVTITIDGNNVPVSVSPSITVTHTFDEIGETEITITAMNDAGDSITTSERLTVAHKPEVRITEAPETSVKGDTETIQAAFNDALTSSWEVKNGTLKEVGDAYARVVCDTTAPTTTTIITVSNGENQQAVAEHDIEVKKPSVHPEIDIPGSVTVGEAVEFDGSNTEVEHAELTTIDWEIAGKPVGSGEQFVYTFTEPGSYSVKATLNTDRGLSETVSRTVTVSPKTDVTAVIVQRRGETTADAFELTATNSVAKNTAISDYIWDIDGKETRRGDTITCEFDRAGEYEVSLRVEGRDGASDRTTKTITVEEHTAVDAVIDGPTTVEIGEEATFDATPTSVTNTTINDYEWELNGQPVATGEEFQQTFSNHGHHTVKLRVETDTGETDIATQQISVQAPHAKVTAVIEVISEKPFRVNEPVTVSASPSTVRYRPVERYEWEINGTPVDVDAEQVDINPSTYGTNTITLTVKATDGSADTDQTDIYVKPALNNPVYTPPQPEDSKEHIVDQLQAIFTDSDLKTEDANWSGAHLIADAHAQDIDVDHEELEGHIAALDATNITETDININPATVEAERGERVIGQEKEEESEASDEDNKGEQWDFDTQPNSVEESTEQNESSSEDMSAWDLETATEDPTETTETEHVQDTEESFTAWEQESQEETAQSEFEESVSGLRESSEFVNEAESSTPTTSASDSDIQPEQRHSAETDSKDTAEADDQSSSAPPSAINYDRRHTQVRLPPEEYELGGQTFSTPNYIQDLIDFEYVFDQNDNNLPDGVNGAGMIVADDGNDEEYIAIAEIQGRDWSNEPYQVKEQIAQAWQSKHLGPTEYPFTIEVVPTSFDIKDHIKAINKATTDDVESPGDLLLNIGRAIYPNWLEGFMKQNDMKDRKMYIVVRVSKEQIASFMDQGRSVTGQLEQLPLVGNIVDRFTEDKTKDISKYQCLRELNSRMQQLESNLEKLDIKVNRIADRDQALSVLYSYYNNEEPEVEVFPRGPMVSHEEDGTIAGMDVGQIVDEIDQGPAVSDEEINDVWGDN